MSDVKPSSRLTVHDARKSIIEQVSCSWLEEMYLSRGLLELVSAMVGLSVVEYGFQGGCGRIGYLWRSPN